MTEGDEKREYRVVVDGRVVTDSEQQRRFAAERAQIEEERRNAAKEREAIREERKELDKLRRLATKTTQPQSQQGNNGIESALKILIEAAAFSAVAQLTANLDERIEAAVDRVLQRHQSEALQPLEKIIGGSVAAARMRINRSAELRSLGVRVGKRLLFRREEVLAAFDASKGPTMSRSGLWRAPLLKL